MLTINLKLTQKGAQKLNDVAKQSQVATRRSLRAGIETITRPLIVNAAPSRGEEEDLTSIGDSDRGMVGIGGAGRFEKAGFKWIQEAIGEETANTHKEKDIIWGRFGQPKTINPKIGFGWRARDPESARGGDKSAYIRRTTRDADAGEVWKRLIEAWEYGSGPFIVKPRNPRLALHPEKDVYVKWMKKSIGPWKMFQSGYRKSKNKLGKFLDASIKNQIRAKFG